MRKDLDNAERVLVVSPGTTVLLQYPVKSMFFILFESPQQFKTS